MELGIVGFATNGKEQVLFTVFVPVCPVKLTALNAALLHASVAVLPLKSTVPKLWVNVPPVIVNVEEKVEVPEEAVNVPPVLRVNPEVSENTCAAAVKNPAACT